MGIGDYDSKSGLAVLHAPANDASEMKFALERLPQPFNVVMITDDQAKDRDAFQAEFDRFLSRVDPGDDVLFDFSGDGFSADKKNYYLTKSSKSDTAFFKDLGTAELRELDTADKKAKRYRDFIIKVALSEEEIERAIGGRKPMSSSWLPMRAGARSKERREQPWMCPVLFCLRVRVWNIPA